MRSINIIVAVASNGIIGKDNDLPWRLPSDLKYFKEKTINSTIIMGRKCFESIGRPLPNRENIVLSRNKELNIDGCTVYSSLDEAINKIGDKKIFIIGGSEIYKEAFKIANNVFITKILKDIDGDVYLSGFNENEWKLLSESETLTENDLQFNYQVWAK